MQLIKLKKIETFVFDIKYGSYLPNLECLIIRSRYYEPPKQVVIDLNELNVMSHLKIFKCGRSQYTINYDFFKLIPNIEILYGWGCTFTLDEFKTLKHIKKFYYNSPQCTLTPEMIKYCNDSKIVCEQWIE